MYLFYIFYYSNIHVNETVVDTLLLFHFPISTWMEKINLTLNDSIVPSE